MSSQTVMARIPLNGVDTPTLFATLDTVRSQRNLAQFQFRATNRWLSGTHSRSTINGFYGAGQEHLREHSFELEGDHPQVLVGDDNGPTPIEFVLHALATCLTSGLVNIAAARGITLTEVESTVEGDINFLGIFGMDDAVRNGYQGIRASFRIKGDASENELRALLERSKARSAVYDILTNGVPIDVRATVESA
jgi:uncharacterized OsmC-like protein